MENNNQEMDLFGAIKKVFLSIGSLLLSLVKGVGFVFRLSYRYKWTLLVCILLGLGISLYFSRTDARVFKGSYTAKVNNISIYSVKDVIDGLETLCKNKEYENLALELNKPIDSVKLIADIKAYYILDYNKDETPDFVDRKGAYNPQDTTVVIYKKGIYIEAQMKGKKSFQMLQQGLQYLFDKNPEAVKDKKIKINQLQSQIAQIDRELSLMDSLQRRSYFEEGPGKELYQGGAGSMILVSSKQLFHQPKLDLLEDKNELEGELKNTYAPSLSGYEFNVPDQAVNGRFNTAAKFAAGSYLVGLFFVFLFHFRRKIFSYLNDFTS